MHTPVARFIARAGLAGAGAGIVVVDDSTERRSLALGGSCSLHPLHSAATAAEEEEEEARISPTH